MISQFFVLSQRGDNIVFRDYRGEVPKGSAEIFFRKVKFWKEDGQEEAPPVFNVDGVNYFHVKVVGLLFVATTRANVSPSIVLELLQRIARVIKDYVGVLNEDSIRKNFVLVYELLDEVIDFGFVQTTSTELLKSYIFNEPIVIDAARLSSLGSTGLFMQGTKRMPGTAVTKSVVANEPGGRKREEIFVDIIEKISVTFSSSGYILTSEIDGTIQMKSYLTGNPEIRLALNEDLGIGRDYRSSFGSGAVILDDCNFHESVRLDNFDVDKTLTLVPPDGEFPVMNYRMTQEFKPPFRINALIEEAGSLKAEVILKLYAEFPSNITANTISVQMPLPKYTMRASFELEPGAVGQTTDFKEANKRLEWGLKKIVGGSEHTLRARLTFSQEFHGNITKEAGPVSMTFTIPMYNSSKLQVKYLQIAKKSGTYNPYRWVRYVTLANSYVARI
ncbi:AP-4 complex subunit mu isoform X2 [Rosa rugosa]|uniref:Putative clathrin adaptor, mu subunit n=1 Tax=Rosa chinensis TaxID=74649 RepID=A0A2P6PH12_ROSCH|nr:AP-4 complex subunit mu [Rosa chinensis]XP_062029547.1 AP-4 complex subunit mu isoform X2 [Rosa rugosa]PRQ21226.1 putative clathrin adaptor, mu subunit [Rosa chinensis]